MALHLENQTNQFGVPEEYWKILKINIDIVNQFCDITIGAYYNQEARDNGSEPMNLRKVRAKWSDEEFNKYFSPKALSSFRGYNIYQVAYNYVKQKDEMFSKARNC